MRFYCLSCGDRVNYDIIKPKICPHCSQSILGLGASVKNIKSPQGVENAPRPQSTSQLESPKAPAFSSFHFELEEESELTPEVKKLEIEPMRHAPSNKVSFESMLQNEVSSMQRSNSSSFTKSNLPRERGDSSYSMEEFQKEGGKGRVLRGDNSPSVEE